MRPSSSICARSVSRLVSFLAVAATYSGVSAYAVNIAPQGTGILGNNVALDSTYGTLIENSGSVALINDGLTNNGVDTFNTATGTATVSFVGIRWTTPRLDSITSLTLTMETFLDGGWFGPNNQDPGNGVPLTPAFLSDATVQFSLSPDPTAVGAVWTSVAATSDYLTVMNGHLIGGGTQANPTVAPPATWTLATPLTGVTGIRLIGLEGGSASTQGGFIGVRELAVEAVPEPSTFLALIGGAGLLGMRRRLRGLS
jgi:hypothetical protein